MIQGNKICLIRDCDYRVHNYFRYNNKTIFSNDMKYLIHALGGKNELNLEKQESEIQIVKGVLLSKRDRDIIDRKLSERVGQMKPYVSADVLEIVYENIMDGQTIAKDLYVMEIIVKPWGSDILLSTSKGDVYIKTEGGKQKLDAQGIQNELKSRMR